MSDDDEWLPDADADAEAGEEDVNRSPEHANSSDATADSNRKGRRRPYRDEDDDDDSQLRSFYEEAAINKNAGVIRRSNSLGAISAKSATSNLSLGELSRLEENTLSQFSHHQEEEERQRKKLDRRARRKSGVEAQVYNNFTAKQIARRRVWHRFKNDKAIDVSQEQDVGGSMEYLVRERLSEQAERKRLKSIAKAREEKRKIKLEKEAVAFAGYDGMQNADAQKSDEKGDEDNNDGMWNYLEKGFVNMPLADAEKLPYYVYKKTECENDGRGDCADLLPVKKKKGSGKQGLKQLPSNPNTTSEQLGIIPRAFPLHFNQLTAKMDLHAMVCSETFGSERMVFSHGKNAVRLWARMVANGLMVDDFNNSPGMKLGDIGKRRDKSDDGSVSNVSSSSSSESSVHSYHPEAVHSQMTYGTTSVVAMNDKDDNDVMNNNAHASNQTPLFRLMAMVHKLPKSTHRSTILLRIALDIGVNRGLWENELARFVGCIGSDGDCNDEGNQKSAFFTPTEQWAIKSFFGVDGSLSSPPSWASDPSMSTHPQPFKMKIGTSRNLLMTRFRRFIKMKQKMLDETGSDRKESNHTISRHEAKMDNVEQIASGTSPMNDSFVDEVKMEQSVQESSNQGNECKLSNNEGGREGVDGEEIGHCSTAAADGLPLRACLLNLQKAADPGAEDKYAKIIHETNIDSSLVDIAIASFVAHLTSSKARLQQMQELDSSHTEHRNALNSAVNDVKFWYEHIESYLRLTEALCAVREANFYRSGKSFPQSAPLAKAVMALQSYFANSGGVGFVRKRKRWERHDENNSSSDSEATDDTLEATMLKQNPSTIALGRRELRSIKLAARELARQGKDRLLHRHLVSFTPIHFTTGIAIIADNVTPSAAELVSRECCPDSLGNRTPFDLIKNMLTLIEVEGSLITVPKSGWGMRGKIIDETLVKVMQEAATVFQTCTEKDPENVDHWSWYVATLLGMVCIAFGSSRNARAQHNAKVDNKLPERPPLHCFLEIRNIAAGAMRQFFDYAHSHDAPMFHLAVATMLEWNMATFLLHRPQDVGFGSEVKRLHAYHVSCLLAVYFFVKLNLFICKAYSSSQTLRWANTICSTTCIAKVRQLCDSNYLHRDALLGVLAGAIEHNPCAIEHWEHLVLELGAIDREENNDKCLHHEKSIESKVRRWWGAQRVVEWEDQFFHAPSVRDVAETTEFVRTVMDVVERILPYDAFHDQHGTSNHSKDAQTISDPSGCIGWIWNPLDDTEDMDPVKTRNITDILTLPNKMTTIKLESTHELFDSGIKESLALHPSCKALCMKILVAGHLTGVQTHFVCNSVWWFAVNLWQSTQTANERMPAAGNHYADGLAWLAMRGIDISLHLKCRLKRSISA